ncbi:hypothetical protein JB92DRAFT_158722 [Gautieria morchelliformis]|nr:hypothetical protein JB92DRAFT_158722 [Gautieria morchelliformis]
MEYERSDSYQNEDERNVHVWASARTRRGLLVLTAGIYTFDTLTICTFYRWLDLILMPARMGIPTVWVIVPCGDPRRRDGLPNTEPNVTNVLSRTSTNILPRGHYRIVCHSQSQSSSSTSPCMCPSESRADSYHAVIPLVKKPLFESRSRSRSPSATLQNVAPVVPPSPRNQRTRKAVRLRDLGCRITGQPALGRNRGINFEGLEVAHIFPLAAQPHAIELGEDSAVYQQVKTREFADLPHNAMLLRADVHSFFDNYQIGVDGDMVYRFEKSAAPITFTRLRRAPAVSPTLLEFHFLTGLLWHVAKGGRKPQEGALCVSQNVHEDVGVSACQ